MHEDKTPWFKNPYVWLVISLPLSAVIAGIITIRLAVVSDDGLVADDYYKQGLGINRVLEKDNRAEALALTARLNLDYEANEARIMLLGNADFMAPESVEVKFLNATRKGLDQELNMAMVADNLYSGPLPELPVGQWYVQIEADDWRVLETLTTQ